MDWRAALGGVVVQIVLVAATIGSAVSLLALLGALTVGGFVAGVLTRTPESARFDGAATMLLGTMVVGAGLLVLARFQVGRCRRCSPAGCSGG